MILQVDSPILLPMVLKLAKRVDDIPFDAFRHMLIGSLTDPNSAIFLDKHEKDPRGFMFVTIERFDAERVAFVHLAYIDPKYPNICRELLTRVRNWAKEKGLEYVYMMTPRHPAGFIRKYHFEFVTHVLRRRV